MKGFRLLGLRFTLDYGPQRGAPDKPFRSGPSFTLKYFAVMSNGVDRHGRIGTHAIGRRAVARGST